MEKKSHHQWKLEITFHLLNLKKKNRIVTIKRHKQHMPHSFNWTCRFRAEKCYIPNDFLAAHIFKWLRLCFGHTQFDCICKLYSLPSTNTHSRSWNNNNNKWKRWSAQIGVLEREMETEVERESERTKDGTYKK